MILSGSAVHTKGLGSVLVSATEAVDGTPAAGRTSFSSKIDFGVVEGLNGGASWTLIQFKGGAGSNSPLLNLSRTTQDSLTVTFAATCKTNIPLEIDSQAPVPVQTNGPTNRGLTAITYDKLPAVEATTHLIKGATGLIQVTAPRRYGTITWNGYIEPVQPNGDDNVFLTGVITDAVTQTTVGSITVRGRESATVPLTFTLTKANLSQEIIDALENTKPAADYWATIPGCDSVTAASKEGILGAAFQQNQILLLRGGFTP